MKIYGFCPMKIFILGYPESGHSDVAQALCQNSKYYYVDGINWVKQTFRVVGNDEHEEQYYDAYHQYFAGRLAGDPDLCLRNIKDTISCNPSDHYIIDGIASPRDFATLFDYAKDIVVFLNRTDNEEAHIRDYEKIGVSVIRDYCFWMSSANLLEKERWLEYNFKMHSGDSDRFKAMGSKNSVFIVGSMAKVILHLEETLGNKL